MKHFFYIVYPIFFFAMTYGIYVSYKNAEGLVDNNYYNNGTRYFQEKATEKKMALEISRPDTLKQGSNTIQISAKRHGKPFEHAVLSLFIGNLSTTGYDSTMTMQEASPGMYQASATIPFKGIWFVRIDLRQQQLMTSRKWFFDVR